MLEGLRFAEYRFVLEARTPVYFPPYKGSVLRGALGTVLKRVSCSLKDAQCPDCMLRPSCPYGVIFESGPGPEARRLRNFEQVARPFVLRHPPDQRTVVKPGDTFEFNLVLVGRAIEYLPYFIVVFRELGEEGMGLWRDGRRGQAHLRLVTGRDPAGFGDSGSPREERVFDGSTGKVLNLDVVLTGEALEKWALAMPRHALTLEFLTMTRLQHGEHLVSNPEFHVLVRALLRRFSTLAYFYHGLEPTLDFRGLIAQAEEVLTEPLTLRWEDWQRYSSRQKAAMNLGGLVGKVRYRGNLESFLPLLAFGSIVHVGKNSTFGLGQYSIVA
ncbi:MAG TPA: CRISPR system precrRNA processing endoribonuclease RAMP protein Cas6 [Firmicutes bacterium]|nr:CRISPR system precrRNA processing endoribonuclease RAMP protein Cas6 [Bacillota bacterium]